MDKYTLLLILNLPFVVFGYVKAFTMYKAGATQRVGFLFRIVFWTLVLFGLLFAQNIYHYLQRNNLTDSAPLSLADVVLTTGIIFALFLIMRLYAKNYVLEKRLTDLHEKLSIITSNKTK